MMSGDTVGLPLLSLIDKDAERRSYQGRHVTHLLRGHYTSLVKQESSEGSDCISQSQAFTARLRQPQEQAEQRVTIVPSREGLKLDRIRLSYLSNVTH